MVINDFLPPACPSCGLDGAVHEIELKDPGFGLRSQLQEDQALFISSDGTFKIRACTGCGFKWLPSKVFITTSRLRSRIYEVVLGLICSSETSCSDLILKDLTDLFDLPILHSVGARGNLDYMKVGFLEDFYEWAIKATADDLVEAYIALTKMEKTSILPVNNERVKLTGDLVTKEDTMGDIAADD